MLLYTKIVEENGKKVKKIYAAANDIPAITDSEVTYKDADGDVLTINENDTYVDATYIDAEGKEHGHGIVRLSDGRFVSVYAGDVNVIPGGTYTPAEKVLKSIELNTKNVKKEYEVNDTLNLEGLVVTGVYESGEKEVVTGYTTSPVDGATLDTAGEVEVTVSYTEGEVTKTATFNVTVSANEEEVTEENNL